MLLRLFGNQRRHGVYIEPTAVFAANKKAASVFRLRL